MNASSAAATFGQPGAFPRNELQADETVIFEGKPSMVATCLIGIIWLAICLAGGVMVATLFVFIPVCAVVTFVIALLVGLVPFLYFYVQYSGTSFALTNRRAIVHKTDSSLHKVTQSLPLSHITHTVRSQSFADSLVDSGNIGFSAAAGMPGFMWPSVPGHDTVRPFIDEQINRLRGPVAQPQAYAPAPPPYPGYSMAPPVQPAAVAPPPGRPLLQVPGRRCPSCGMNFGGEGAYCPYCGARA